MITTEFLLVHGFRDGVAVVIKGNKLGFIDKLGTFTEAPKCDRIGTFSDGVAGISHDMMWGLIDKTGKILVEPKFRIGLSRNLSFSEGLAAIIENGKWGFIDKRGEIVIEPQFEVNNPSFTKGFLAVKKEGKWGVIDKKGKYVMQPKYPEEPRFNPEGYAEVQVHNLKGYLYRDTLKQTVSEILPTIFEDIKPFPYFVFHDKNNWWVKYNGHVGVVKNPIIFPAKSQAVLIQSIAGKEVERVEVLDNLKTKTTPIAGKVGKKLIDIKNMRITAQDAQGKPLKSDIFFRPNGDFLATVDLEVGENMVEISAERDFGMTAAPQKIKLIYRPDDNTLDGVRNVALVIGMQDYEHDDPHDIKDLNKPVQDSDSIAKVLQQYYTFEAHNIRKLHNPTKEQLTNALDSLYKVLGSNDNLLIFYAGHGYWSKEQQRSYWFLKDSKISSKSTWFPISDLIAFLASYRTRHTLLITDACFSGGLFSGRDVNAEEEKQNAREKAEKIHEKRSCQALTSGSLEKVPDDSKFLQLLCDELVKNKEPYLYASDLAGKIQKRIGVKSQEPRFGPVPTTVNDVNGDFIFIRRK
jgi:hypothetical protein